MTDASKSVESPYASYQELGVLGRVVAGTVETAITSLMEFLTGFVGGYLLGTITDTPRFLFRPTNPEAAKSLLNESLQRFSRMHEKSMRWGKSWGSISATFAGCTVLVRVLRNGKSDEWTATLSSCAAGMFFSRKGTLSVYHP